MKTAEEFAGHVGPFKGCACSDCRAEFVKEIQSRDDEIRAQYKDAVEALEKLARLGNGDRYGNSDGNIIAQEALAKLEEGK